MKKIILFSGKAENGKTTAATILKSILEKRGDSKFYDVESGICVNIAQNSFDLPSFQFLTGL